MALTATQLKALLPVVERTVGAGAEITHARRLIGGASRELIAFDVSLGAQLRGMVLSVRGSGVSLATDGNAEARAMQAAHERGVPVPIVHGDVAFDDGGPPGLLTEFVEGEALPQRILRHPAFAAARRTLVAEVAAAAAKIHAVDPSTVGLEAPESAAIAALAEVEEALDMADEPHPAIELGLRHLRRCIPNSNGPPALVHGDLRLGNLLVSEHGLAAILDWELVTAGDPAQDLGWLCARSWRFGSDELPALGLASRDALLAAYTAAGGSPISRECLWWWEALANARWAAICVLQAHRRSPGRDTSLELAAIGRRACEAEWDLLAMVG